jgi:hypothetical protein
MMTRELLFATVLTVGTGLNLAAAPPPWGDAVAVWDMSEAKDSTGKGGSLGVEGEVTFGVELTGAERDASLRRDGDGRVAKFNDGYLRAARPAAAGASTRVSLSGVAGSLPPRAPTAFTSTRI